MRPANNHTHWFIVSAFIFLCLAGCNSKRISQPSLPSGLSVEEYALKGAPEVEPLTFIPVHGTQAEILSKHQQERGDSFPDNSFFDNNQPGMSIQMGNEKIMALESFTTGTVISSGIFQKVTVQVSQDGKLIYSIPAGDAGPVNTLRGLWTYSNHWVLEIVHATLKISSQNEASFDSYGQIIQDGEILNERYGYDDAFGYQMMDGNPFYFFKKGDLIGISYDDQEIPLRYTEILHYGCCSAAATNPQIAQKMVAFFAQRNGKWYYVEIGVFN